MITNKVPLTWQDLQTETARILEECGFTVEIEKKIQTVRGEVEIDVYAEEEVKGRKYTMLVECKHWKSRVPQTVIHGFRTVVSDIGANVGYIVSLTGFQSGSFSASEMTNVELANWNEFQNAFEESWYDEYFSPEMARQLDPLMTYVEPLLPRWFTDLAEDEKKRYLALKKQYEIFGWMIMGFTPYVRMIEKSERPTLPIIERVAERQEILDVIPIEILKAESYREFFDSCLAHGLPAIEAFREIKKRSHV